jgi:hypothetical protein
MVDDVDLSRRFGRGELEAELFLEGSIERGEILERSVPDRQRDRQAGT